MTGINWAQAHWTTIALTSLIFFNYCDISYSNFYELKLTELSLLNCKAQHVDFRGGDLAQSNFTGTDFANSEFMHTKLQAADFREAVNYNINPVENNVTEAKFSFPDVVNLLHSFEIDITGI
jgi:uncharacterized protein YjbI with pentapeptide repeats